ncbi:hypothetical protein [Streptomyces niveus]|uniref:hypothetical protein n=1 Tax=Streptomyces niveus TaxID=193462 RepID=UPI00386499DC
MTRLQLLAVRLVEGSGILFRRLGDRTAAWVHKGRRDDLTGIPALLGVLLRMVMVCAGLWALWRLVRAVPNLLWLLTVVWCWCAAHAARPDKEAESEPEDLPAEPEHDPREQVLRLLYEALGDRPAMYLSEVLQYLQERGHGKGWKVADLRVRLEALGIPVELKLKTGGKGPTRGVVRAQLPPLSQPDPQEASPAPSTAA